MRSAKHDQALVIGRLLPPLFRCKGADRQCVNFVANQCSEAFVHELVTRQRSLTLKLWTQNQHGKMRIVVAHDRDRRIVNSALNKALNLCWLHLGQSSRYSPRVRSVPRICKASQCHVPIVYYSRPESPCRRGANLVHACRNNDPQSDYFVCLAIFLNSLPA